MDLEVSGMSLTLKFVEKHTGPLTEKEDLRRRTVLRNGKKT